MVTWLVGKILKKGACSPPAPCHAFVRVKHQNHAWKEREQKGKGKARIGDSCSSLVPFEAQLHYSALDAGNDVDLRPR